MSPSSTTSLGLVSALPRKVVVPSSSPRFFHTREDVSKNSLRILFLASFQSCEGPPSNYKKERKSSSPIGDNALEVEFSSPRKGPPLFFLQGTFRCL